MKQKLLLHTCCATCSVFLAEKLSADYQVTVFFDNSNIYPKSEYDKRLKEAKNYFEQQGIEFVESSYDHQDWLMAIAGLESEPERGKRCLVCYRKRLLNTALYAKENDFDFFASTLSISPHKDAQNINNIGEEIAEEIGLNFLAGDWKKNDGFKKAMEVSRQCDFYRQNYCGCEFSLRTEA